MYISPWLHDALCKIGLWWCVLMLIPAAVALLCSVCRRFLRYPMMRILMWVQYRVKIRQINVQYRSSLREIRRSERLLRRDRRRCKRALEFCYRPSPFGRGNLGGVR